MKKQLVAVSILTLSLTAIAQSDVGKFYAGGSFGRSSVDTGITAVTATLDETDTGAKFFAGYKYSDTLAVEVHYADLGEASLSGNNGNTFKIGGTTFQFTANNAKIGVTATSFGVSGLAYLPINQEFKPFVRLGIQSWETKLKVTSSTYSGGLKFDGTDPFFGLGLDYKLNDSMSARVEYEVYKGDGEDVDLISAGLRFSF